MLGRLDHSLDTEVKGKTEAKKKNPKRNNIRIAKLFFLSLGGRK